MKTFRVNQRKDYKNVMKGLGYINRPKAGDFLRYDTNGRFHAVPKNGNLEFHYDLIGENGTHIASFPLNGLLSAEQSRVVKYLSQHWGVDELVKSLAFEASAGNRLWVRSLPPQHLWITKNF